jgi:hypothetical protein
MDEMETQPGFRPFPQPDAPNHAGREPMLPSQGNPAPRSKRAFPLIRWEKQMKVFHLLKVSGNIRFECFHLYMISAHHTINDLLEGRARQSRLPDQEADRIEPKKAIRREIEQDGSPIRGGNTLDEWPGVLVHETTPFLCGVCHSFLSSGVSQYLLFTFTQYQS